VTKKQECIRVIDDATKLQQELDELTASYASVEEVYAILDEQSRIREHITKGVAKLSDLKRKVSDCDNKLEVKEVSTNLVRSQLKIAESNEETIKKNRDHREAVKTLNAEISKHTAARSGLDSSLSQLDRKAGILTKEISTIEDTVEKLRQCDKRHRLLSLYCSAMHRTGLQVDILRNHLPRINYEVNKILSDVVNFQVFLRIEEGETDIDIVMQYGEMDTRPAQMASGMEKLLINMAIRYALLTVSNLNTSSSWFIDEGFGVLDAENMSAMSQFFDNVRSVFRNIIIITHIDTLKDVSDWTIGIERRDEISVANSPVKNI
jgi:DNA repair exonuclease SbcCD ATPase subunit